MRPARTSGDAAPPFSVFLLPPSGFEQEVGEGEFAHFGQAALGRAPALPPAERRAEVRAAPLRSTARRRHRRSRQAHGRQGDSAAARRLRQPAAQDAGFASHPFAERYLPQFRMPALGRPAPLRSDAAKDFPLAPVAPTPLVKKTHAPLRSQDGPGADPGPRVQAAKIVRKAHSRQYTESLSGAEPSRPRQATGPMQKRDRVAALGRRRTPRKAPARRDRRGASRRRHGATGDSAGGRRTRCLRTDSGTDRDAGGHRRLASCCDTLNRIRPDVSMTRSLRRGFPAPRRLSTRNLRSAFFAHCQP